MSKNKAAGVLSSYFKRSIDHVKKETVAAMRMDLSWKERMTMFTFNNVEDLEKWVVGSDADIGGYSEAFWGLTPEKTGLFWGNLSTEVPPNSKIKRSGYAGIRSKEMPLTLFHRPRFDTTLYRYLAIRARGDSRQWFLNLQADSLYPTHLWQHRIYFKTPGQWETVMIPFQDFVLTANGFVQARQIELDRAKVKTVGFSVVRQPGEFSLEVDWIAALNTPTTLGDYDVLEKGTYIDEKGVVRRLKPGEKLEDVLGPRLRVFPAKTLPQVAGGKDESGEQAAKQEAVRSSDTKSLSVGEGATDSKEQNR